MGSADDIWAKAARLLSSLETTTIFDVGANRGDVTHLFLQQYPRAKIYAFEPDPATVQFLQERFTSEPRVLPSNAAAFLADGSIVFNRGIDDTISSVFTRNKTGRRYYRRDLLMKDEISVSTISLDRFCAKHQIPHIHLLKLDTQGSEYDALRGAHQLLSKQKIDVVLLEFFLIPHYEGAPLFPQIWALLNSYRYGIFDLQIQKYGGNGQARWGDAIFISDRYREARLDTQPEEI